MAERIDKKEQLIGATSLDVLRHVIKSNGNIYFFNIATFNEHYIGGWNKPENEYIDIKELDSIDPFATIRQKYVEGCQFGIFSESSEPNDDGGYLHLQTLELDIPKSEQAVIQITDMVKNNRLFAYSTYLLETDKSYQLIGSELIDVGQIYSSVGYLMAEYKGLLSNNGIAAILLNHGTTMRIPGIDFQNLESKVIKII